MLGNVCSGDIAPLMNKECTLRTSAGAVVPVVVVELSENPRGLPARAAAGRRVPFSVLMTGPQDPAFTSDTCTFSGEGFEIAGVFVNRIVSQDFDENRAWYQVVFG